jgi:gluconokinase
VEEGCREHVRLVYLKGIHDMIQQRLAHRTGHFMGPELLQSQFAALEEPLDALVLDAALPPEEIVRQIRSGLGV